MSPSLLLYRLCERSFFQLLGFSGGEFAELVEAGSIDGENGGDRHPTAVGDLIAMGVRHLLDEPVGAQQPQFPTDGR